MVSDSGGCTAISAAQQYIALGINFVDNTFMYGISPNPSKGNFSFHYTSLRDAANAHIRILDLTGKIVAIRDLNIVIGDGNYSFDLMNKLSNGIYFFEFETNNLIIRRKLIIE